MPRTSKQAAPLKDRLAQDLLQDLERAPSPEATFRVII